MKELTKSQGLKIIEDKIAEATSLLEKASSLESAIGEATTLLEKTVSTTSSSSFAQREHLDTQLADITNRRTPLQDILSVKPANGLTHEWDMITALGSNDTATLECGTPPDNELTIVRYSAQIKTFATKVKVCDRAQWGASDYFDIMNTHLEGGMRRIVQDVEKKLFYGNSGTNAAEFDGIYTLVDAYAPAGNMIDASHATISQAMLDNAIKAVVDAGGMPTHIFMGAKQLLDFAALWSSKVTINDPGAGISVGYNIANYMSFAGPLKIVLDPFITGTNSPNAPYSDVFVLSLDEMALAQAESMYKLPPYRGLDLAETQTVVWNTVLELKIPQWQSVIYNLG